jgi:SAM-dependent methyltransferase
MRDILSEVGRGRRPEGSSSGMARIDFVPYPPTSFPFRDLLVLEQLPLGPSDDVCEIGVGSGGTTARLAKICASVTGFEISRDTIDALRYLEQRFSNLRFIVGDITLPEQVRPYEGSFTRVIACDTLEHVKDPRAFFEGVHRLLAPGGEFLVTFPNEPADKMHGITRFDAPADLAGLVAAAGLIHCRIGNAVLAHGANQVADALGWGPLKVARKVLRRGSYKRKEAGAAAPQTFDQTHFMKNMGSYKKLAPALNLYWYGVLKLMDVRGPAFEIDWSFEKAPFTDCQVFLTGRKPLSAPKSVPSEARA